MLEEGSDSIAPPPHHRAAAPAAILPDRPMFAESASDEDADGDEDAAAHAKGAGDANVDAEEADTDDADANADANNSDANKADADDAVVDTDDADVEDADAQNNVVEAREVADPDPSTLDTTMHPLDDTGSHTDEDDYLLAIAANADVCTPSPKPQGASRTDGGIICGHANGNVFNFGDVEDHVLDQTRPKVVGRVLVYDDRKSDEPCFSVRQEVTDNLKEILTCLSDKHSPVRSV